MNAYVHENINYKDVMDAVENIRFRNNVHALTLIFGYSFEKHQKFRQTDVYKLTGTFKRLFNERKNC
jgi:hypothetical protein